MSHLINVGIATCTPVPHLPGPHGPRLAMITTEWHRAKDKIMSPTNCNLVNVITDGMEVGEARCKAVELCMGMKPRPEFLFFHDYDVIPAYDAMKKLLARARWHKNYDIFCGVYCSKADPAEPLIYNDWGRGPFWDWKVGDLLTTEQHNIVGIHMGLTLIRLSMFDRKDENGNLILPWNDSNDPLFCTECKTTMVDGGMLTQIGTEDLYFCKKVAERMPLRILVDTSVLAGHIDHSTGRQFGLSKESSPVRDSWLGESPDANKDLLLALDIGAGTTRRHWEGYKTETTDIRAGVADYCMDTRWLNFPDGRYDLVATSHHLEHIPRWEQELVWNEMFRVLKPGGKIEHVVPSSDWAAHSIYNGIVDEHVVNVLYGAQEAQGYEREWNLHFFPYTKGTARELAEAAGFVDVTLEDWRDGNEDLKYNLVIRGRKPALNETTETPASDEPATEPNVEEAQPEAVA